MSTNETETTEAATLRLVAQLHEKVDRALATHRDQMALMYRAWNLIANCNWPRQNEQWKEDALAWRDTFHELLPSSEPFIADDDFNLVSNPDIILNPEQAIAQALGYASVCWDNMSGTGTFQSEKAKRACDMLVSFLYERMPLENSVYERALLNRMGYIDGAEVTSDGSNDNDLAHERFEVAKAILERVRRASYPQWFLDQIRVRESDTGN